jgi:hypothetical protein
MLERVEGLETAFKQIKEDNKEEVKKMMEGMFSFGTYMPTHVEIARQK